MKTYRAKKALFWLYIVTVVLSFMEAVVYLTMRPIWYFIDKTLGGSFPWALIVFILICASFIFNLAAFIKYIKIQREGAELQGIINVVIPIITSLFFFLADAFLYMMLGSSQSIVFRNFLAGLPYVLLFAAIAFFVILYPSLKILHGKLFRLIAASVIILGTLLYVSNIGGVAITSGPFVQLVDDSNLAVIWTTNCKSTAYVEYGSGQDNLKKVYSYSDGVIDANSTTHKVVIPVDKNSEFIYRVVSQKINNYFPNNVEYGSTAVSDFRKYTDFRLKDNIAFYILNDVHENTNIYKSFLEADDYDFVVLNGDAVNSVDSDEVIIDEVLKPVSEYTNGTRPVYFVRGNHEARGGSLRDLPNFLALPNNSFYYTFSIGPIFGIVLDSGEDKLDSDDEYSGLADFKDYREDETKWLETLSESQEYKDAEYKIAFVHIPLSSYERQDNTSYLKTYQQDWRSLLNNMRIDALFSGHTHKPRIIEADDNKFDFPTFIGGGEAGDEKDYVGVKVEVTKESMKISYLYEDGSVAKEYEIKK